MEKAQILWYLLQGLDRDQADQQGCLAADKSLYPYFYLLDWNARASEKEERKTALRSMNRWALAQSLQDAPVWEAMVSPSPEPMAPAQNALDMPSQAEVKQSMELIDAFLEKLPSMPKSKRLDENRPLVLTKGEAALLEEAVELPVSETLAKILMRQEKYQAALGIYEALILKFPEKSRYFATQIENLKQIQTKQT